MTEKQITAFRERLAEEFASRQVPKFCPDIDGDGVVNFGWVTYRDLFLEPFDKALELGRVLGRAEVNEHESYMWRNTFGEAQVTKHTLIEYHDGKAKEENERIAKLMAGGGE